MEVATSDAVQYEPPLPQIITWRLIGRNMLNCYRCVYIYPQLVCWPMHRQLCVLVIVISNPMIIIAWGRLAMGIANLVFLIM